MYVCMGVSVYVYMYVCINVSIYGCMLRMYVYIQVCMFKYVQ